MKHLVLDTSCIVALVSPWHERHADVTATLARASEATLVVVAHTLLESYSVLTRLPAGRRLAPADALLVLRANFEGRRVLQLATAEHWPFLDRALARAVTGGRVYDALIASTAALAVPVTLLTLNPRHFTGLGIAGLDVVEP